MYIPSHADPDEAYLEAVLVSVQGDNVVVDTKGGKVRPGRKHTGGSKDQRQGGIPY